MILFPQHRRHAELFVVDLSHQLIGWSGNQRAGEHLSAIGLHGPIPQTGHAEDFAICEVDVERLFAPIFELVRLVEAGHRKNAALAAIPRSLPEVVGLQVLDLGVDQDLAGGLAVIPIRHQVPAHHATGALSVYRQPHRDRISGEHAPALLESPERVDELPIPFGGGLGRCLEAGAHRAVQYRTAGLRNYVRPLLADGNHSAPKTFLISELACPMGSVRMARSSSPMALNRPSSAFAGTSSFRLA